jgi:hypothetical protein
MRALWAARSDRYARPVRAQQMLAGPPLPEAAGVGALTFGGFLTEVGDRYRDNEALVFDDPRAGGATVRWTYGDLEHHARRVARALLSTGIGKGARVGILMGNAPRRSRRCSVRGSSARWSSRCRRSHRSPSCRISSGIPT